MQCTNCKYNVPQGTKYCPNCGAPLQAQYVDPAPNTSFNTPAPNTSYNHPAPPHNHQRHNPQKKSNNTLLIIICAVLALAIIVVIVIMMLGFGKDNPTVEQTDKVVIENVGIDEHMYDWLSERKATAADFDGVAANELRLMRNAIMAKHGYIFNSADLANYFSQFSWYHPTHSDVNSYLSPIESANVALIRKIEKGAPTNVAPASYNLSDIGYTGDFSDIACYTRLTADDVRQLTKEQRRILRNTIYARHGRKFKDAKLRNYFNSFSWYTPLYDEVTPDMLSDIELANINLIQKYE